ncbi:568_t:CDS:2 [Paraglomus occultum]|uniref:568_t:CDS:1 n=1 Tax=Paraglomus occultum TaxID=144539 RepID=A0A9N8ZGJ3_9GLOM|nr:568_t:CDS:2 [Paraglomus occultum]
MSQNAKSSTRGRKRRTVPTKSDFTGRNHSMIVNVQKQRVTGSAVNYKERQQHLLPTVEDPADTVNELTQEQAVEQDLTNRKKKFAEMTTEQLRIYAICVEVTLRNRQPT